MNDSVLVWGGVAVLVLIAVILYCLWRLLTRRPAAPGTGGVTVDAPGDAERIGRIATAEGDPELAGVDLAGARARARAAAAQRAGQHQLAGATADEDAVVPGLEYDVTAHSLAAPGPASREATSPRATADAAGAIGVAASEPGPPGVAAAAGNEYSADWLTSPAGFSDHVHGDQLHGDHIHSDEPRT